MEVFELMTKYSLNSIECTWFHLTEVRDELKISWICKETKLMLDCFDLNAGMSGIW